MAISSNSSGRRRRMVLAAGGGEASLAGPNGAAGFLHRRKLRTLRLPLGACRTLLAGLRIRLCGPYFRRSLVHRTTMDQGSSKICPHTAEFSPRPPKSDRLPDTARALPTRLPEPG